MALLTPIEAAAIAHGVYALREHKVSDLPKLRLTLGCENLFTTDNSSRFEGRSGALAWHALSGFRYVAQGIGRFAGDVLIVMRGTQTSTDRMTNFNIGLTLGPSGRPVHQGFEALWSSFVAELRRFLHGRNPTRIHCVGHSLGGALASLNADLLAGGGVGDVMLYTFGSPRTGGGIFAHDLTRRVRADQIFRVAHPADPVPMIPLFPFWHLPFNHGPLGIAPNGSALVSVEAHLMPTSYIPGVAQHASWGSLLEANAAPNEAEQVRSWLERAADGHGAVAMGSARLLSMIGRAMRWLLAEVASLGLNAVGFSVTASFTVLDRLAWLLAQGAALSRSVASHLKGPMASIFAFLGRTMSMAGDVTVGLIRWVPDLLYTQLRTVAQRALHRGG